MHDCLHHGLSGMEGRAGSHKRWRPGVPDGGEHRQRPLLLHKLNLLSAPHKQAAGKGHRVGGHRAHRLCTARHHQHALRCAHCGQEGQGEGAGRAVSRAVGSRSPPAGCPTPASQHTSCRSLALHSLAPSHRHCRTACPPVGMPPALWRPPHMLRSLPAAAGTCSRGMRPLLLAAAAAPAPLQTPQTAGCAAPRACLLARRPPLLPPPARWAVAPCCRPRRPRRRRRHCCRCCCLCLRSRRAAAARFARACAAGWRQTASRNCRRPGRRAACSAARVRVRTQGAAVGGRPRAQRAPPAPSTHSQRRPGSRPPRRLSGRGECTPAPRPTWQPNP